MVPRTRSIGDPIVPLNDTYPRAVAFIYGWRTIEDQRKQVPIGTGFFVGVPVATGDAHWQYLVTAKHVVENEAETWVRVPTTDGLKLFGVPEWTRHPSADVAVAHVASREVIDGTVVIRQEEFLDGLPIRPALGDPVYFIGLLGIESMIAENVPMVRSGTLGRYNQSRVPLRFPDQTIRYQDAHLIDCRSYAGFSGSPCFVQTMQTLPGDRRANVVLGNVSLTPTTAFLGLISGHLDNMASVEASGIYANDETIQNLRFRINTGVGIVTPVERIRECLMEEELVAARKARDERALKRAEKERIDEAGTLDGTADSVAESRLTRGQFEDALRKVSRRKPSQPDE